MKTTIKKMFKFMRPYMPSYIPGVILYNSQVFVIALASAGFLNLLTAAILNGNINGVWNAAFVYAGIMVVAMLLVAVGIYLYIMGGGKATRDMKFQLFRSFVNDNIENAMTSHSGEGIAAINTDADTAANLYTDAISPFARCIITIILSAVVVFAIDFRLGIATAVLGGLSLFSQSRFAKPLGEIGKKRLAVNAASVSATSNIFSGGLAIRAFNIQDRALFNFNAENGELQKLNFKQAFIGMWQDLFTTIQGWMTLVIVFALGGWLVATGQLDFPMLIMALPMCVALGEGMAGIGSAWAGLQAPKAAAERVLSILETQGFNPVAVSKKAHNGGYALQIKDTSFKYKGAEDYSLNDISLTVHENEMVAFVGASGSGKSTLLRTVIGMYDRDSLNMQLGNLDFTPTDAESWRQRFAYVDQSCKLFDMSVGENIALGLGGNAPIEAIKEAAINAWADEFISSLPEGYETPCGEKGASLSGGQKQRIAIARALCRKAPILVFDEATSALDVESERSIMETVESLRKDYTILIVTHNLKNTTGADKIVVMDNGRIAETGTHETLMENEGLYHSLFLQNTEG